MWAGAVSTGQVKMPPSWACTFFYKCYCQVFRQFSQCSLEEMNSALGGFPESCLEGGISQIMELEGGISQMMEKTSNISSTTTTPSPTSTHLQSSNPPIDSTTTPVSLTTAKPNQSPSCETALVEKQLAALTGYVRYSIATRNYHREALFKILSLISRDLWHLQEDGHLRKTLGGLQR